MHEQTRLLFVRHGYSVANREAVFGGCLDYDLTETGHKQAEIMAEYVLKKYNVDSVYASDLSRAVKTAEKVAQPLGLEIQQDKRLREIDGGAWNGMTFEDIRGKYTEQFNFWKTDLSRAKPPNGETVFELQKRALEAIADICEIERGKTVLVATHRVLLRTVQCKWEKRELSDINKCEWLSNCSVSEVMYDNGSLIPINIGQDDFMGKYITTVTSSI